MIGKYFVTHLISDLLNIAYVQDRLYVEEVLLHACIWKACLA